MNARPQCLDMPSGAKYPIFPKNYFFMPLDLLWITP